MIAMDSLGKCRVHKANHCAMRTGVTEVTHAFDGVELHMSAWSVCDEQHVGEVIDAADAAPKMLGMPLPMPFGKQLLLAPVHWHCTENGVRRPLSVARLDELLGRLASTRDKHSTQTVLLHAASDGPAADAAGDADEEESVGCCSGEDSEECIDESDDEEDVDDAEEEDEDPLVADDEFFG